MMPITIDCVYRVINLINGVFTGGQGEPSSGGHAEACPYDICEIEL